MVDDFYPDLFVTRCLVDPGSIVNYLLDYPVLILIAILVVTHCMHSIFITHFKCSHIVSFLLRAFLLGGRVTLLYCFFIFHFTCRVGSP